MGFSRQEHWSGLSCPPLGGLPSPGIESRSPALQVASSSVSHQPSPRTLVWGACPSSRKLPDPGIKPGSPACSGSLISWATWQAPLVAGKQIKTTRKCYPTPIRMATIKQQMMASVGGDVEELEPSDIADGVRHGWCGVYHIRWYSCSETQSGALWQSESSFTSQEEETEGGGVSGGDCDPGDFHWKGGRYFSGEWGSSVLACQSVEVGFTGVAPRSPVDTRAPSRGESKAGRSKRVAVSLPHEPACLPRVSWAHHILSWACSSGPSVYAFLFCSVSLLKLFLIFKFFIGFSCVTLLR